MAQQPTAEELRQMQAMQNQQFMALSYEQPIMANSENGNAYQQGRTLNFSSPIVSGAWATRIELRHKLKVNVKKGAGDAVPTAGYPYSLVNNVQVTFGNKQVSVHPYIAKVHGMLEGYARTVADKVKGFESAAISNLLNKVPASLAEGDNEVVFSTDIELNNLHPASINGILPLFSSGTRLQIAATLPSAVAAQKADPLDSAFVLTGDAEATVTGTIDVIVHYRDHVSMADATRPLQPNISGLPTVQVIQMPAITNVAPGVWNYAAFRNPYRFAKLFHLVIDGKSSTKFAGADNITGYEIAKAENSNSAFVRYADEVGMASYYKEIRSRFGTDLDEGVVAFDATTANIANVSGKMGAAYLNLDGAQGGYPAARFGVKLDSVGDVTATGIAPRVVTFGVLLNPDGIRAV